MASLSDDYGFVSAKRICPYCHNMLPTSAGHSPAVFIAITGSARSGKSLFYTSLINYLKRFTARSFMGHCTPLNKHTGKRFDFELAEPLFDLGMLPKSAQLEECPREPFVFSFRLSAEKEVKIAFFDPAGTIYSMDMYSSMLKHAAGVIHLIDPLQLGQFGKELSKKNFPETEPLFQNEPADYLHLQLGFAEPSTPIAVVLTKADLLKVEIGNFFKADSAVFEKYNHRQKFSLQMFHEIDNEIHKFLFKVDPGLVNGLTQRYTNLGFFGVSALGSKPEFGRVKEMSPTRIDEPFLWILHKLGIIPDAREA